MNILVIFYQQIFINTSAKKIKGNLSALLTETEITSF